MYMDRIALTVITGAFVAAHASAGLDNFLITNGNGILYEVDGNTLQSTQIAQLDNAGIINEILYVDNGEILANVTGGFERYNLNTGVQTTVFSNATDLPNPGGVDWSSGAALTSEGDVYFSVQSHSEEGSRRYGALYDLDTNTVSEMAEYTNAPGGLYFDFHEIGTNLFLAAEQTGQTIRVVDAVTGDNQTIYNTGINNGSFLSLNGDIFVVTTDRDMYTFDETDGSVEFYGSISGVSGNLLGATAIPAPSTPLLFALAAGTSARRRRST